MRFILLFIAIVFPMPTAYAQESDGALVTYEPPPLFAAPRTPPPKVIPKKIDVIDKVSKEVIETKQPQKPVIPNKEFLIQPRVVKEKEASLINKEAKNLSETPLQTKSNFTTKTPEISNPPVKPIPKLKPAPILTKKEKSSDLNEEPIDLLKKEAAKKDVQTGVVTGPKTMPSIKKQSVEAEQTYVSKDTEIKNFQRKEVAPAKTTMKLPPAQKKPSNYIDADQKKFILKYGKGRVHMTDKMVVSTLEPLSALLRGNGKNIEIKSYASKVSSRLNSDRKISLDRGLALREYFISKGVKKHRMNLRSYGNKTSQKSSDYIEITILN